MDDLIINAVYKYFNYYFSIFLEIMSIAHNYIFIFVCIAQHNILMLKISYFMYVNIYINNLQSFYTAGYRAGLTSFFPPAGRRVPTGVILQDLAPAKAKSKAYTPKEYTPCFLCSTIN